MKEKFYKPEGSGDSFRYRLELPKGHEIFNLSLAMYMYVKGQEKHYLDENDLLEIANLFELTKKELDTAIKQIWAILVEVKTNGITEGLIQADMRFIGGQYLEENGNIVRVDVPDKLHTKKEYEKIAERMGL